MTDTHSIAQFALSLRYDALLGQRSGQDEPKNHALLTTPVFTGDALLHAGDDAFSQYALYGEVLSQEAEGFPKKLQSPQLFINSNAPFSAIVCGVQVCRCNNVHQFALTDTHKLQGSGKSHSTNVLLESCLMQDKRLGTLPAPLSGLVYVMSPSYKIAAQKLPLVFTSIPRQAAVASSPAKQPTLLASTRPPGAKPRLHRSPCSSCEYSWRPSSNLNSAHVNHHLDPARYALCVECILGFPMLRSSLYGSRQRMSARNVSSA